MPLENPRRAQKKHVLDAAYIAIRQGLDNGMSIEKLFAVAGEAIAFLKDDTELQNRIRRGAGFAEYRPKGG